MQCRHTSTFQLWLQTSITAVAVCISTENMRAGIHGSPTHIGTAKLDSRQPSGSAWTAPALHLLHGCVSARKLFHLDTVYSCKLIAPCMHVNTCMNSSYTCILYINNISWLHEAITTMTRWMKIYQPYRLRYKTASHTNFCTYTHIYTYPHEHICSYVAFSDP